MSFTQNDRVDIDALFESYCDTNLANWLDADQIFEIAFEVYTLRKRKSRKKNQKFNQRKRQ